jgi:hypothetical protein
LNQHEIPDFRRLRRTTLGVWQTNPLSSERRAAERRMIPDRRRGRRADSVERRNESERRISSAPRFPGLPQLPVGLALLPARGR